MTPLRRTTIGGVIAACLLPSMGSAQQEVFRDVYGDHPYAEAIEYVKDAEIVRGFADGSFRSDRSINRAEAVKMIVSAVGALEGSERCIRDQGMPYDDVGRREWFAPYVCVALQRGIISTDGQTQFRPSDHVNIAEMSTMLARAFALPVHHAEEQPWYEPAVRALGKRRALPVEIRATGERLTRGQLAEMVWRLQKEVDHKPFADPDTLLHATCTWRDPQNIPAVDDEEVVRQWFEWVNGERRKSGLHDYVYDKHLSQTALQWSQEARSKGAITHKRSGQTAYYDYALITDWFADNSMAFENRNGITYSENIGWGVYSCRSADCTKALTIALRTTFDMYMAEQDKASRPHYNSMMNKEFTRMGVGIETDKSSGRYYVTVHYATAIISNPDPLCP